MGPVVERDCSGDKMQGLIEKGIEEGAELVCGGPGRPEGLDARLLRRGRRSSPTSRNDMTIAREEIFGPVLCILPYDTEDEAIRIANDTPYGLSGYVVGRHRARAGRRRAHPRRQRPHQRRRRSTVAAPFGGYKQSGNGREWGAFGFEEFLEVKSVFGAAHG